MMVTWWVGAKYDGTDPLVTRDKSHDLLFLELKKSSYLFFLKLFRLFSYIVEDARVNNKVNMAATYNYIKMGSLFEACWGLDRQYHNWSNHHNPSLKSKAHWVTKVTKPGFRAM